MMKKRKERGEMKVKIPRVNPWAISTLILLIILAIFLIVGPGTTGRVTGVTGKVTAQEAADKAIDYINDYILQGQGTATLISVKEENDLYNAKLNIGGRIYDSYITMDGRLLFPSAVDLMEIPEIPEERPTQQPPKVEVSVDDDPVKGSEDAPVTIIEFSDFQCPFCAKFYQQTLPQIEENYIKTGKVKLVFRDFPLSFHQHAQKAAEAAECADEQGKFWEYHDKLFENQRALDEVSLKQYAADLGLDTEKFNDCLDNGEMTAEVQKDFQDGQSYGVSGTPAFFINGRLVSGAQPFSAFKQVIDSELSK